MEQLVLFLLVLWCLVSLALCILFYSYKHFSGQMRGLDVDLPPGRIGLPIIGESLEFVYQGWKGHPEKFIFDRIATYSSELFKTSILAEPVVIFSGPAGNKFLFSNENKLVSMWYPDSLNKVFPSSVKSSSAEEALKLRKMLRHFLEPETLQHYVGVMDSIAQRHFTVNWDNKEEVVVYPLTKQFTIEVAARVFTSQIDEYDRITKFAGPLETVLSGMLSIPIDLHGTPLNKAKKASEFLKKELMSVVKQRRVELALAEAGKASPTPTKDKDILSHMLLATDGDGNHISEVDIAEKILGLLIGGYSTLNSLCTFIVKYLAELPHIYQGVYQEHMDIKKSKALGELLNWNDLQKMKYSWNVAREVLRLVAPVHGTFRQALTDITLKGFRIPKGWKLYWSAYSTHLSASNFAEPYKFDPSRFSGKGPAPYTFVPFGGGPRMCPGVDYTRMEVLVFMHNLVTRYKLERVLPHEKVFMAPMPKLSNGLPVRLYPHNNTPTF